LQGLVLGKALHSPLFNLLVIADVRVSYRPELPVWALLCSKLSKLGLKCIQQRDLT